MNKLLAVIRREYLQRVRTKFFVFMTVVGPLVLIVFTVVPGMLFNLKTSDTRIAIVDETTGAQLYGPVREALLRKDLDDDEQPSAKDINPVQQNSSDRLEKLGKSINGGFVVEQVNANGRTIQDVKRELNGRIRRGELEGYLVLPADILTNSETEPAYYGRNVGDVVTREQIEDRLNSAVRRQRLIQQGVKAQEIDILSRPVDLANYPINEKGEEGAEDSGAGFSLVSVIAFLIYMTVLLYGQVVLGAVVEEKETRIAEILFSSIRPFQLMAGKLIGVSLMALTQLVIWITAFVVVSAVVLP